MTRAGRGERETGEREREIEGKEERDTGERGVRHKGVESDQRERERAR